MVSRFGTWRSKTVIGAMVGAVAAATVALAAAPAHGASSEEYVAMGDSAASGNGTRLPDLSLSCYRSSKAYGPMIAEERADTTLSFPACQGAETGDIVNAQVTSLSAETDWVTVSIGGNDIGFADLILNCMNHWDEAKCLATVDDVNRKIEEELPAKLDKAYAAINDAAPNATVMTIGYPRFFGDDISCPDADGSTAKEAEALNGVADNLDAAIADRSAAAGFTHVSVIEQFTGHDMCADLPYVNGKMELNAADAYHPSPEGYKDGFKPLIRDIMG
ncbi:SGNH/GDSL hydrolase family protein [Haloechinothrix halophila]|uniref:SGNH/GDSL hydrolase family protein n=1 Tax=Haloechinothrix halophila TaxID=1069073 RepID=UPI0003F9FB7A|nr:SGNH/GDSL hydrolase family protein [Haloechinothrix halophila]